MLVMSHRYHAAMLVVVNGSVELAQQLSFEGFDVTTDFGSSIDALVHVPDLAAAARRSVANLDDAAWDRRGEALLRDALHACQAAYAAMKGRGGRIVLVTPTIALVGAEERAPFAMACEGMRTLAKVAARQWGGDGITANCIAPALDTFGIEHDAIGTVAPALGRTPGLADVAWVIAAILRDAGAVVTGVTIPVDGGVVMP
jgi:NAD(P)-dependent dehydrogenase (short-subunit alcohol dehydrogenase family)